MGDLDREGALGQAVTLLIVARRPTEKGLCSRRATVTPAYCSTRVRCYAVYFDRDEAAVTHRVCYDWCDRGGRGSGVDGTDVDSGVSGGGTITG
jgi:hypothetical protein